VEEKKVFKRYRWLSLLVFVLALQVRAAEVPTDKVVIFDFEAGGKNHFEGAEKLEYVPEHATEGHTSGKADLKKLETLAMRFDLTGGKNMGGHWGDYDQFIIDVFVEGGAVKASNFIRDPAAINWESRYNSDFVLKPGQRKLVWSLHGLTRERGGKLMDPNQLQSFSLVFNNEDKNHPATIYLDNARLVKATDEAVPGMKKFSFGPPGSSLMPGFSAVNKSSSFDATKGYGWLPGGNFNVDFDISEVLNRHRPADDLCRHCSMPNEATFAVKLPNGDYRGWLMMAPPRFGWAINFKHRTVKANGKVILDQEYTAETFKEYEYAFQDVEDLPGEDLWEKYIQKIFVPTLFDFSVTDGQLKMDFDAHGQPKWGCTIHALAIWPKDQETAAAKWLTDLNARRKEQYETQHVEKLPNAPEPYAASAEDNTRGYVRFINNQDKDINVNSVPVAEEAKQGNIELSGSPGEYLTACFGVYPLHDCGTLKLSLDDLSGPGGAKIQAQDVQLKVVRYKDVNAGKLLSQSACYTPIPKYMDVVPAAGIPIGPGVTRSFWMIAHVPSQAPAGTYKGEIALNWSGGQSDKLPISLTVWPIKLDEPDMPIGIFLTTPSGGYMKLDPSGALAAQAWKEVLDDTRAHGQTSVDPDINIPLKKYHDGKAEVDFSEADRFMEGARAVGFTQEICGYGVKAGGLDMKIHPDMDLAAVAKKWGAPDYGELAKAYFNAVREHAKEHNWLPICWSTDDEFLVHPGGTPEKLAAFHRTLQQSAPDFHFGTYDSVQYDKHPDKAAEFDKMLADIDTWGAGIHSPREAELAQKNGRRLWLYNQGKSRYTFGTYMFFAHKKNNVSGFFQWVYPNVGTYSDFYLASHNEGHMGVVYPSSHGLRTTPMWERMRNGINDYRYMETAWNLIEKAKAAGKANLAAGLQSVFDKTFSQLEFGKSREKQAYVTETAGDPAKVTTPAGLDRQRQELATGIVQLQEQLKEQLK
jgi:hypothetical protein